MQKAQLKGYILEEVIAHLIRTTGYEQITSVPTGDPDLREKGNGLNLGGRGAEHQIDVIGELKWIPAFTFPLRLIIEAKFQKRKTGVEVIRNTLAMLIDINENYFTQQKNKLRYRYVAALFSTQGFTQGAIDMAVAHQINLIDLSGEEYKKLRDAIGNEAEKLLRENNKTKIKEMREKTRRALKGEDTTIENSDIGSVVRKYGELFVGMTIGGMMILLKEEDSTKRFVKYAKEKPTHKVKISWSTADNGEKWSLKPETDSYELSFLLPRKLRNRVMSSGNIYKEALDTKQEYFSKITIYYHEDEQDYVFNLNFEKSP